ncbi:DNA damage-repair/toleration protein DRT100 [Camellia lanceoleosa]|uniref:DNA damage-repair/toleration protein DRT100 n=1 Tax=Camellia lanceoleosa TaxID=1840588 RepID=A0ACC0GPK6_9ERIC|nr:DNA damage-repair/toleration protein DRT100 [Camellia lanceoleosa]
METRTDCCKWFGISCDANNHRVTTLTLVGQPDQSNTSLSGTISPSLFKLHYLGEIYLQNLQNLSGPFPNLLFSLPNIEYIYFENSKLSGQIPVNIGDLTRLVALSFAGNRFLGPIPSSISKLTQLGQLKFGENLLTGTIPAGIQQLKKLTLSSWHPNMLKLHPHMGDDIPQNQLTGTVPDIFSTLTELRSLSLSHNKFFEKIPSTISALAPKLIMEMNVKGIESLDLSYNGFHLSEIPKWVTSLHLL